MTNAARLSTHRLLQIHSLEDSMSSKARVSYRAAANAFGIKNMGATSCFIERAKRFERIAKTCRARLEVGA